jgi:hypothetical protein
MIELIHKYPILIKGLLTLVTVTFILTGGWMLGREGFTDYAAKVNGKTITVKEYQDALQRLQEFYSRLYQGKLPEDMLKKMDLNKRAIDALVEKRVIILAAREHGIKVSDEEVSQAIKENKSFQDDNGTFSAARYNELVKLNGMTAPSFETALREDLTAEKFKDMVKDSVYVTDPEVREYYMGQIKAQNKEFKEEEYAAQKDNLTRSVTSTRQEQTLSSFMEGLKGSYKIEINNQVVAAGS